MHVMDSMLDSFHEISLPDSIMDSFHDMHLNLPEIFLTNLSPCEFGKTQVLQKLLTVLASMELHDAIRSAARVSLGFELPEWPDVGNTNSKQA